MAVLDAFPTPRCVPDRILLISGYELTWNGLSFRHSECLRCGHSQVLVFHSKGRFNPSRDILKVLSDLDGRQLRNAAKLLLPSFLRASATLSALMISKKPICLRKFTMTHRMVRESYANRTFLPSNLLIHDLLPCPYPSPIWQISPDTSRMMVINPSAPIVPPATPGIRPSA